MTHPMRKAPLSSSGVGLQLVKLEKLLCKIIPEKCNDEELLRYARTHFSGLSIQNRDLTRTETLEIIDLLKGALITKQTLSPTLVADIHSTIGLLYHAQNDMKRAIRAFTMALWIQAHNKVSARQVEIALSIHRIALCHSSIGNYDVAIALLKKALAMYKDSRLKGKHPYMVQGQEELKLAEETRRLAMRARTWCTKNETTSPIRSPKTRGARIHHQASLTKACFLSSTEKDVKYTEPSKAPKVKSHFKNSATTTGAVCCSFHSITKSLHDSSSGEYSSSRARAA